MWCLCVHIGERASVIEEKGRKELSKDEDGKIQKQRRRRRRRWEGEGKEGDDDDDEKLSSERKKGRKIELERIERRPREKTGQTEKKRK